MEKKSDPEQYTYEAFISYRHVQPDISIAKALHTMLETYRIPKPIAAERGTKRLGKVFRDQEELPVSEDLSRDIINALKSSRFLIVICSPSTPLSKWCIREIELFKQLHGNTRILPLLIVGEPDVSFPSAIRSRKIITGEPDVVNVAGEEIEPLAADIRADNLRAMLKNLKKYEVLRLIAPILGVSFDALRQRERERVRKRVTRYTAAGMLLAVSLGILVGLGLNRIGAEKQRTKLAAQQAEVEHARAETLAAESELAKTKADAEISLQKEKAETEKQKADAEQQKAEVSRQKALTEEQRAELEAQKAETERQRAELETQKADTERQRAEEQQQRANDLTASSALSDLLIDAQSNLGDGWRMSAMQKAARIIKEYSPDWGGYNLVQRAAKLILQKADILPSFASTGTIVSSSDPLNRSFHLYIPIGDASLLNFSNETKTFEQWDINSGEKIRDFESLGETISSMIVEEDQGIMICVLSFDNSVAVMDIKTGKILFRAYPDPQYSKIFSERAALTDIHRTGKPGIYQFVVNKDGYTGFLVTFSLQLKSISVTEFDRGGTDLETTAMSMFPREVAGFSNRLTCTLNENGGSTDVIVRDQNGAIVRSVSVETLETVDHALVTADEKYLAVVCTDYFSDSEVHIYDLKSNNEASNISCPFKDGTCVLSAVIPGQDTLVVEGEKTIYLLDAVSGYTRSYALGGKADGCCLSSSGNTLAVSVENKIYMFSCRSRTLYPSKHTVQETVKNVQYGIDVLVGPHFQIQAFSGDYAGYINWFSEKNVMIYGPDSNDEPISSYVSPGEISCFTLDSARHRLYVYSWELGKIIVWDWEQDKVIEELTTPYASGAVSIQLGKEDDTLYVANGFVLYMVNLRTHAVTETIRLEEGNRDYLLPYSYIVDEANDRVYSFSGDEQGSQILQTVYGVYQLSTGYKICGDMLANSPLNDSIAIRFCLDPDSGVGLVRISEKDPEIIGWVNMPTIQEMLDAVPR